MKQFFLLLVTILLVSCQQDIPNLETNLEGTSYHSDMQYIPGSRSTIIYYFDKDNIGTKSYIVYDVELKDFFKYSIEDDQLLLVYRDYIERGQITEYIIMMSTTHSEQLLKFFRHGKMGRY